MKKLLCVILAIFTFFTLVSCESIDDVKDNTSANFDTDAKNETEKRTESEIKFETESETEQGISATEETKSQMPALTVRGVDISEYKIAYSSKSKNDAKAQAERLAAHIKDSFAKNLDIAVDFDAELERAIIISDTLPEESEAVTIDTLTAVIQDVDGSIWISAINAYMLETAIDRVISDSTLKSNDLTVELDYSGAKMSTVKADAIGESLKVMTYNVKNGYVTAERQTNTVDDVINFMPDTIGVQEFNLRWFNIFKNKGVFDEYEFVGEQRYGDRDPEANDNEYSAILYRKGKFRLIDSGTYWLSETPEVPDTKLEASKYVRIMTYAVLERISDGVKFVHVNTHLNSTPELNLRQTEILVGLVNEKIYSKHGKLPTYFTGDFNASPISTNDDGYKYLISIGTENSRDIAEITSNENTIKNGGMIDHCIVTKGDFLVKFFDVGDEKPNADTSNHFPVYVEMYIIPRK